MLLPVCVLLYCRCSPSFTCHSRLFLVRTADVCTGTQKKEKNYSYYIVPTKIVYYYTLWYSSSSTFAFVRPRLVHAAPVMAITGMREADKAGTCRGEAPPVFYLHNEIVKMSSASSVAGVMPLMNVASRARPCGISAPDYVAG